MKYFILILVSLTVILHYCENQTPTSSTTSSSSTTKYPHTTVKILDWDTIIYNDEHIRLASINAPEIAHWDKASDCWAYKSMSHLETYLTRIRPSSMIRILRHWHDKYWRTIATVYLAEETTSINQLMVRDWYAQSYNPGFGINVPDYSADYQSAIQKQAGILDICSLNNKSN